MTAEFNYTRAQIRASLDPHPSAMQDVMAGLATATPQMAARLRASLTKDNVPAAVLVPLVEHPTGLTVLLTQRADTLKDHAGQISFPGGRIEPGDKDGWHAAMREAYEEIGLKPAWVEFAGYLPDHIVISGFCVTPVVGFVSPDYQVQIDAAEVREVFEVPLDYIFDTANHKSRSRTLAGMTVKVHDIPYGERNIWGATAGILLTLRRVLQSHAGACG